MDENPAWQYFSYMLMRFLRRYWFLGALLAAILIGYLLPETGRRLDAGGLTSTLVVAVIFFSLGVTLPTEALREGLSAVRLHLFIQSFIFVVTPLYFFLTSFLIRPFISVPLLSGLFALSCLPTTVSSCVVLTRHSRGNVIGSTFNASLANALGVMLTPLILSLLLSRTGRTLPASDILGVLASLLYTMLLPVLLGVLVQNLLGGKAGNLRKGIDQTNNALIVLIVFFAISKAAGREGFRENLARMPVLLLFLAVSHLVLLSLAFAGSRLLRFDREDTIAAIYTAPQKTIALGVPLLSLFFAGSEDVLGSALFPLLFYHPWQLIVGGILSRTPFLRIRGRTGRSGRS